MDSQAAIAQSSVTGAQIRAARALLDWSRNRAAAESGVALVTLRRLETEGRIPLDRTLRAILEAFDKAGVALVDDDRGIGAVLKRP